LRATSAMERDPLDCMKSAEPLRGCARSRKR
jgi:hypothetical protein